MKYKTAEDVLGLIPTRKFRGEIVPLAPFKEIIRLLKQYRYSPKELDLFAQEVEQKKADLGIVAKK